MFYITDLTELEQEEMTMGLIQTWGTSDDERSARFPIDDFVGLEGHAVWRGIDIARPAEAIWPWLGQLRLAPYSYDWLDNGFHASPRHLLPDLPPIAVGDPFMVWPRVVHLVPAESLTFLCRSYRDLDKRYGGHNWFANLAQKPGYVGFNLDWVGGSYRLIRISAVHTRALVKLRWKCRDNILSGLSRRVFEIADFVMMRRQLLNIKGLAESYGQ